MFVDEWGDRFRRAAAARKYHHARRGGLVEHTAQMMRVATEIAPLYPQLNLDLLVAGILFHDSGKALGKRSSPKRASLWAMMSSANWSGTSPSDSSWLTRSGRRLSVENAEAWKSLVPASEGRPPASFAPDRRSSWREHEFGSPVVAENARSNGASLHRRSGCDVWRCLPPVTHTAKPLAARIFDRVRPLPGNLVKSLEKFQQAASPHPPADKLL